MIATPERPLLPEDFSSSPEHINAQNQNVVTSHIYHEIPENHQPVHQIQKSHQIPENHQQPIHRPIQAQLFHHQQLGGSNFINNQQQPQQGGSNFSNNQQQPQQGGSNFGNNQPPLQGGSSCNSTSSSGYVINNYIEI